MLRLCLIGLGAHFEAFSKAHFAAIINIHPPVLKKFAKQREDFTLKPKDVLQVLPDINHRIGSLISSNQDSHGGPPRISTCCFGISSALLLISKDEPKRFSAFINDRNLLVHHGGIFTLKYERRRFVETRRANGISSKVLRVEKDDIDKWSAFLLDIAEKLAKSSAKAMEDESKELELDNGREIAVNLLTMT